jgi:hypothetical protein
MSKPSFSFFISLLLIFILVAPGLGQTRVGKFGVGIDGSMIYSLGEGATNPSPAFGGGVCMSYSIMEYFGMRAKFGTNQISWKGALSSDQITDLMTLSLYLNADLMPTNNFNIFPFIGGGLAFYDPKFDDGTRAGVSSFDTHFMFGAGADYFLDEFWSVTLMGEYVLTNSSYYAGSASGSGPSASNAGKDSFMRVSLQLRYYFFDQPFIKKLLEAQRERSKRSR